MGTALHAADAAPEYVSWGVSHDPAMPQSPDYSCPRCGRSEFRMTDTGVDTGGVLASIVGFAVGAPDRSTAPREWIGAPVGQIIFQCPNTSCNSYFCYPGREPVLSWIARSAPGWPKRE